MLIFRGVTILSEGSNFKSLRKKDQLMHHILVLQLHMSWSRVPIDPKRNWTHFPLTKLFLSRQKKQTKQYGNPKTTGKSHPLQPYLQPTKPPNHGVYLLPTTNPDSTATAWERSPPWCCSKQKNQILRSCACANRSERFENQNFHFCHLKCRFLFPGQIT